MTLYALGPHQPDTHEDTWVAPDANLIGKVVLEEAASVWFGTTIRADHEEIRVGRGSNVQENCVFHVDAGFPLTIGAGCTIGHKVMLHGCTIGDNSLIGAGALITENKEIPDGSLVMGVPGKIVRPLDDEAIESLRASARHYQENMRRFRSELRELADKKS